MSPDPAISWRSFPFADRPLTTVFLLSFLLLLSVLLWQITVTNWGQPIFYYGGMLLVIINLFPYFILTEYNLYEDRIEIRYLFVKISRKYEEFGCYYKDKHGLMLGAFKLPRRLDTFRGQSLRFSRSRAEVPALLEFLKTKIDKQY